MAGSRDSVTSNGSSSSSTAHSWGLGSIFKGFLEYKKRLDLPNPGTFEGLHREVKSEYDLCVCGWQEEWGDVRIIA